MTAAIRAEWIKLTTTASSWVLVALALALPLLVVGTIGAFASESMDGSDLTEIVTGFGMLCVMLLAALSTISITSEFTTNTIRPTFAALPDRWRPLLGKLGLQVAVTIVVMLLVVLIGYFVGSGLIDGDQSLDESGVTASLVGLVVLAILLTVFGYAIGLLVRSTALAIVFLLLWPLLAETIIGGLLTVIGWEDAMEWMPAQAGFNLIDVRQYGDEALGRVGGGAWFALWVVVLLAIGLWRTYRRDA